MSPSRPPVGARRGPRRAAARAAVAALLLAIAALVPFAGAARRPPPRAEAPRIEGPDSAPVRRLDGEPYVGVNDLARLLGATKFWRADLRKLTLRGGHHSITFTVDNPFVVVDATTLWMGLPVRSVRGELQIPAALADSLPSDSTFARLYFDGGRDRILVLPPSGGVGTPAVTLHPGMTRIGFPADDPASAVVVGRSREHFRIRFGGLFTGALPESLPSGGLIQELRPLTVVGGSAFEFRIAREAVGYRLVRSDTRRRLVVEFERQPSADLEPFAAEGPIGPRPLKVVVLDPGHGGSDPGVIAAGVVEKDLTLALARMLRDEIERRTSARVVLTRGDDRDLTADQRAEIANRSRADLVISLHFDGNPAARARGATAWCPPATLAGPAGTAADAPASQVRMLPWRDVALRHAVASRALAEAVLAALELHGQGPIRLRERLPLPLLGINAPGMVLECAALTTAADRDRVRQEGGLRDLAATVAEGVLAWQRNE